jgi:DNA-binding CsgD family transcriptional regulator
LERPELDIKGFASRLGCDEETIRATLDQLAEMSLLQQHDAPSAPLVAVSPVFAMQQLINQEHKLLARRQEFLLQSYETLCRVLPKYTTRFREDTDAVTEQIRDLASIRRRLEELAVAATTEVLSFSPAAVEPHTTRRASRPLDQAALARGVSMRTIYLDTIAYDTAALSYAAELVAAGGEVRVAQSLPMRLVIVDHATAVVPTNPVDSTEGCLVIHHCGAVVALAALFDSYWRQSVPLSEGSDADRNCTAAELSVLRMLATGAKDEAVARQLGLSVRTVRRCIADLMTRVDASSRFELGVRAVAEGWL